MGEKIAFSTGIGKCHGKQAFAATFLPNYEGKASYFSHLGMIDRKDKRAKFGPARF